MTNIYADLSKKIDEPFRSLFIDFDGIIKPLQLEYFLVGAQARDIFLSKIYDCATTRATMDFDFAIQLADWDQYSEMRRHLLESGKFNDSNIPHRFIHNGTTMIDIIPFGNIEAPPGQITWQSKGASTMSMVGFQEAYDSSVAVTVSKSPSVDIRVCTLAGLVILKLIAWTERETGRNKDAKDILSIMKNYLDAGNSDYLFGKEKDILDDEEFDYERGGVRLLGRHIGRMSSDVTRHKLLTILDKETSSSFSLIRDMQDSIVFDSDFSEIALNLLQYLLQGINDG